MIPTYYAQCSSLQTYKGPEIMSLLQQTRINESNRFSWLFPNSIKHYCHHKFFVTLKYCNEFFIKIILKIITTTQHKNQYERCIIHGSSIQSLTVTYCRNIKTRNSIMKISLYNITCRTKQIISNYL